MALTRVSFAVTDDPFYADLRARVRAYLAVPGRTRHGGPRMWGKSLTLVGLIVGLGMVVYSGRLSGAAFIETFMVWQFVQFLTTIGIAHDATHGAYARSPAVNRAIERIFDVLGIDSKHWIDTHVHSHHAMPNVPVLDTAIESFSLVRLHPRTERTWLSRRQHYYMFFVYALVTIFQVYLLEPIAFAQRVTGFDRSPGWRSTLARMVAKKLLVLGYSLLLPLAVLPNPWSHVALGWLLGHMLCGLAVGVIFQTTHLHQGTSFIEPDGSGRLPDSFAMHILKTTAEFSTESRLITWIAGGLNLHVTHHLFPSVSQMHLPALSRIVRETAREHGVPYVEYTLFGALRSHLRLLARLGSLPSMSALTAASDAAPPRDPPRLGLLEVLRDPKGFTRTRTELLLATALRHGPVVRLPKPFARMFLVSEPSAVRRILVDNVANYPKSEEYRLLGEWVGRGLITSEGEIWASDRKALQPDFHPRLLRHFATQAEESARARRDAWSARVAYERDVTTDILEEMMQLSLVIIGHRLFGRDVGAAAAAEISARMGQCQEYVTNRMLSWDLSRARFRRNMAALRALIEPLALGAESESLAAKLAERGFDRSARMDHLLGFLVAGHETTAVALTWTLLLLAKHPEVQDRARREGPVFLQAVIEEAMRLYPPIPCFGRRALEDDVLGGYRIPAGSKVIVAQHVTHRLPAFWTDPERFDPERFLQPRKAEVVRNAYYPFGMGPRTCVGGAMAMMECRIVLEVLLERFRFEPAWGPREGDEPRAVAMISLRPDRPVMMRVTARSLIQASDNAPRAPLSRSSGHHHRGARAPGGWPSGRSLGSTG